MYTTDSQSTSERRSPQPAATGNDQAATARPASSTVDKGWVEVLRSLVGKSLTIVNPESYEEAPVGHQIREGFYRGKIVGLGRDYVAVATEFVHAQRGGEREPVRQYIPFSRIKRVSVMKSERVLHI